MFQSKISEDALRCGYWRMILRKATLDDLALLQHWDRQEHVIASGWDEDWDWEVELQREPPWRAQLIAEIDGRPIGILQIIDPQIEETHYWGEVAPNLRAIDIWIGEASDLGQGFGTQMMQMTFDLCFSGTNVQAILIDPLSTNTHAIRFYERLGFQFVEERNFEGDDCMVYKLDRSHWESMGKNTSGE